MQLHSSFFLGKMCESKQKKTFRHLCEISNDLEVGESVTEAYRTAKPMYPSHPMSHYILLNSFHFL
jgi:hypothetical protein